MSTASMANHSGLSRIKLFMALSRTPHGILDMATPALTAMLWLGAVPPLHVTVLGLLTAIAGYTAVYALNDVVDYRVDREKLRKCGEVCIQNDLDAVFVRHPMAQGLLTLKEGVLWTAAWGAIAVLGAYTLNPACAVVFLLGCVAEAVYCLMLQVSYLRVLVSGGVKTAGGVAAVFAVASSPSVPFLVMVFLWLFFWEIGGQNVPNDWSDMEDDRSLNAETTPMHFGMEGASWIIMGTLLASVVLSLALYIVTPADLHPLYLPGALILGAILLLLPAHKLYLSKDPMDAAALFNRASYYPLVMFVLVTVAAFME